MFSGLSREQDEEALRQFPGSSSVQGLNMDRIRGVIEAGGDEEESSEFLVQSIQQVVQYDPALLALDLGAHWVEYSVLQNTDAAVLKKLLELWPVTDPFLLEMSLLCKDGRRAINSLV